MCGRFTLSEDLEGFAREFALRYDPAIHNPRFNIAPTQSVAVVLNDNKKEITMAR